MTAPDRADLARALLARPMPVTTAAALFLVPPEVLAGAASAGHLTLADAFRAAVRHLSPPVYAARAARRGAMMRARRRLEAEARAWPPRARVLAALDDLARQIAGICAALVLRIAPLDARLARQAGRLVPAVADARQEATQRVKRPAR